MKTLLLALGIFSLTAHAENPVCKNRAVTVIVKTDFAQRLIDHTAAIDSIPLGVRILHQTDEATVENHFARQPG